MKFQTTIKEVLFILLFSASKMKRNFISGVVREMAYSIKASHFCFDEINTCADVSFHMISFQLVFT